MKINDQISNVKNLGVDKVGTNKVGSNKSDGASATQAGGKSAENVTLSPLASQLNSLEEKVAASKVFDSEKVEAIKSAISSGQFKVDSGKVADGLIASVRDLLTAQR